MAIGEAIEAGPQRLYQQGNGKTYKQVPHAPHLWLVPLGLREIVLHPPLHRPAKKKPRYLLNSGVSLLYLGWLMGLEPTTTGITILDSTN